MFIERPLSERQCGLTLIELIVFIIIVSVGLAGILTVFNVTVRSSADPMIRKQMLSIAEALLEEVELQPFTYCDPTDATWATAGSATVGGGSCTATVQGLGAGTTGQTRISAAAPFNNVPDYNGASSDGGGATGLGDATHAIADVSGAAAAPLGYRASITVTAEGLNGIASVACASANDCTAMNMVRIAVQVFSASGDSLVLEGYRARYWPNDQPW